MAGNRPSNGRPEKKPRRKGIYKKSTLKRNIARETQEKTELYLPLSSGSRESPEKASPPLLVAGRREEDARERKEKRFWVRLRGEVRKDGFAVAVAVGR